MLNLMHASTINVIRNPQANGVAATQGWKRFVGVLLSAFSTWAA